ncbi:alpha/beta hydrolase [Nocardia sp. NRRL S-836]|uniref:alpha/beta hydrolase n=1 Tax=Nocardia sp. NRRL S-836 TaxID=1519492 RepID=UPI000A961834|nr:alpha/beta hydrolase [Nocardia sp. NRRL S-836]
MSDEDTTVLPLRGGASATLVRRRAAQAGRGAILYVHGFADYFFQEHVAAHFTAQGYDFYAVDLRGYGRSLREGEVPNYTADMAVYYEEIDAAIAVVREEHSRVVLMGHSTGGLTTSLWAHERRDSDLIDALVLNSPWLDVVEPPPLRRVVRLLGKVAPSLQIRRGLGDAYGASIHSSRNGEWDFDVRWKPLAGFPVRAGWIRAVLLAQEKVHAGLDVRVPVLVLHSDRSVLNAREWTEEVSKADAVLDVEGMRRWGPKIGSRVRVVEVKAGLHDLFLSPEPVRAAALAEVDAFLETA